MPQTVIYVFRTANGDVPLVEWLDEIKEIEPRAYRKCIERILLLSQLGNELRSPLADLLRDGIRELRAKVGTVNYRILYFFHRPNVVCLSHGLTKEATVPKPEIELALRRKRLVERDADKFTADWEV